MFFPLFVAGPLSAQIATSTALSVKNTTGNVVSTLSSGSVVVLTASVTKTAGGNVTLGTVNFCDAAATYCEDAHLLGSAQVTSNGTAVYKFLPAPGEHSYKAVFHGTTHGSNLYAASTSGAESLTVTGGPFATTTTLVQSGSVGDYTLATTVTSSSGPTISPSGSVDFLDTGNGNYVLGSATLTPGPSMLSYAAPVSIGTGASTQPMWSVMADFNQDGIPDLAVIDFNNPNVESVDSAINIYFGNADGTFTQKPTIDTATAGATAIVAGDLNGDGYPDLIVAADGAVNVFINNGSGGFDSPANYNLSYTDFAGNFATEVPTAVAVGDVNNDGHLDVVFPLASYDAASTSASTGSPIIGAPPGVVGVALGNGDGSLQFSGTAPYVPLYGTYNGNPGSIVLVDLTGNGNLDIVTGSALDTNLSVLPGNGDGTFQYTTDTTYYSTQPAGSGKLVVADFNGDGKPDLAFTAGNSPYVSILIGNGNRGFTFSTDGGGNLLSTYVAGNSPYGLVAADLNGDGIPDLATANNADNTVTVMLGNGDGTFQAPTKNGTPNVPAALTFPAGDAPYSMQEGVFSASGIPSLVVVDENGNSVSTLAGLMSTSATGVVTGVSPVGASSGLDEVQAKYMGDSFYGTSTSATLASLVPLPVPTILALTSSLSTVTVGSQVTLTATISPASAQDYVPTGAVTFYSNGTSIGTATITNGVATLTPKLETVQASDLLTASYPGDSNFNGSTSAAVSVTVQKDATALSLQICNYNSTWICPATTSSYGGEIEVNVSLTPFSLKGGPSTDGDLVTFYNNGTVIGTAALSFGSATLSLDQPVVGNYSFTASYPGDASFVASSTSTASNITVQKVTPSVALGVSPTSTTYSQPVYLTATFETFPYNVSGDTVTFYNGTTSVGSAAFGSGSSPATLTLTNLPVGSYNFSASYPGDGNYLSTTTTASAVTIQKEPTALTVLAPSSTTFTYGSPVTVQVFLYPFNATGGNSTNGELVTLIQNGVSVGTAALSGGAATFTVNEPPVGTNAYTASYAGDASFGASTAAATSVTVQPATTTMGIATNALHGIIGSGLPVTLTATLSPYNEAGGASTNGESVTFYENGTSIGTGTLANGVATYVIVNGLAEATYTFSASYAGDASFTASTASPTASLTVLQSTTLTLTTNPAHFAGANQPVSITVTLSPYAISGDSTNNQLVYIYNGSTQFGNATLTNGVGTYSIPNGLPTGTYSLTAVYDSDGKLANSTTASPVTLSVATTEDFVVNTTSDDPGSAANCNPQSSTTSNTSDGACSLRDALLAAAIAPEGANINFDTTAFPGPATITLNYGTLTLPSNTTLTGPVLNYGGTNITNLVTVDGNGSLNQSSSTVFAVTGTATAINNLIITGGWTPWDNGNPPSGGGIANSGTLTLTNSTITGNGTIAAGGGIYNTGTLTVVGSTIANNMASVDGPGHGAGIDNDNNGTLTIINSTIANNTAQNGPGGGIAVVSGTVTITNSTITGNSTGGGAGGIENSSAVGGGTVTLANSIVSQNNSALKDIDGSYVDKGGNIVGSYNGTVVNNPNSLTLGPLDSYGGPTQTMLPLPGSSAICAGTVGNSPSQWQPMSSQIDTDQRGYENYNIHYSQLRYALGGSPLPSVCFDSGAVQTNYTQVQFYQTSYTGVAGGSVIPTAMVVVQENGANRGAVPVTLGYTGSGNLSGNTATTVAGNGAAFSNLSVDTAGAGSLTTALIIAGTSYISASASLQVQQVLQISPGGESTLASTQTPFSQTFAVSGGSGNYSLTSSGTVPIGLTLTPSGTATGTSWTLSGSPTQSGPFNFTLIATDVNDSTNTVSQSYTITVIPGSTTTLTASPATSTVLGQTVTLTAVVSSSSTSGSVFFYDSGNFLGFGPASLSGGSPNTATLALNVANIGYSLAIGAHSFTAQFTGDGTEAGSTSNTVPYNVTAPSLVVNTTNDDDGTLPCTVLTSTTSNTTDGNNGGNPGLCTLRDALQTAQGLGAGSIYFDTTVFATPGTIAANIATYGSLNLGSNTTIQGPASNSGLPPVTIDGGNIAGNGGDTVFVASGTNIAINNLIITNGFVADGNNGGALTNFGTITVSGVTFTGNQASGNGGAIMNLGTLTVSGATFTSNQAESSGGAIFNSGGTASVVNSSFSSNSATGGNGGAIDNAASPGCGTVNVTNSTIYQSAASSGGGSVGGGLYNDRGGCTLTVTSSTIAGNSSDFQFGGPGGGGIFNLSTLNLANSIVTGNSSYDQGSDDVDDYGASNYLNGSNVVNGDLIGVFNGSPANGTTVNLTPFGNYGGPMQTMLPSPGSSAICGGLVSNIPNGITTDERGNLWLPTGGYCPSGTVDSGAVQTNYALTFTTEPPSNADLDIPLFPAPVLTLTESGLVFASASGTVNITDIDGALSPSGTNSVPLASGTATFSNLLFSSSGTNDTLTGTLSLNPNLSTPLSLLSPPSTAVSVASGSPTITSVSSILPQQTQTITIIGSGFGIQAPSTGDSPYIELVDNSGTPWAAGHTGNGVTLGVSSWTDTQILLSGLSGSYGANHCIRPGDQLSISVWNAQTGEGPSVYSVVAAGGTDNCPTKITTVSPIVSKQTQTIILTGGGFGTQAAYTGDSEYIELADSTGNPWFAGHTGNGVTLAVSSWTDSQIVLSGFAGSYGTTHCIRPGDHLSVSVWNAQTGIGPAVYPIVASGGTDNCPTEITSVSPIVSQQTQTIIITGGGFGTQAAYTGDSEYIELADSTGNPWFAGHTGNGVTLAVSSWTDSQIVLSGLSGSYGTNHCIRPGDHLSLSVWNAQTGNGPATYLIEASGGTDNCPTEITSVSPILPQQTQTITITGAGFGTQAAYSGDSSYIELVDSTSTWFAGQPGNMVGLSVSSWSDTQIVITDLPGAYGTNGWCISPNDQLYVKVWNAQTGVGPAVYPIIAGSGTNTCVPIV